MLRSTRHAKILEIISHKEIETQEELCQELQAMDFLVTQATISRDIRDLHLFKVAGIEKKYRYAYMNRTAADVSPKMRGLFRDCMLSITAAKNLVVIRTLAGNGANAGAVVDQLQYQEIVGSVAGDDTLLIVCQSDEAAQNVVMKINEFLN